MSTVARAGPLQPSVKIERRIDGVALLVLDVPGEAFNWLTPDLIGEFDGALDEIERDAAISAVVIISGKEQGFIAGADIRLFARIPTAEAASGLSRSGQRLLNRVESSSKPFVAAISGGCLGGGLELALACQARVITRELDTRLGVPEVRLGRLPGLGGTQRLQELVGLRTALDLMLTGKELDAEGARRAGLVDEVVDKPVLARAAVERARSLARAIQRAERRPRFLPQGVVEFAIARNPLGRALFFRAAREKLRKKTAGNYPAPERILSVVEIGLTQGRERGMRAEAIAFGELSITPAARELVQISISAGELKKDTGIDDPSVKAGVVDKLGIVGAGPIGAGIAYLTVSNARLAVRLTDTDDAGIQVGLAGIRKLFDRNVQCGRLLEAERDRRMADVTASTDYAGLSDAKLVIEAVSEDLELKQRVLQELEQHTHPRTILASNTLALPIGKIAEGIARPERVLGMHYLSPVDKMPLLEVVVAAKTAPWVTATAVALGKRQGKTVIVVRDGVGFYTSRILGPFLNEASRLVAEGVPIDQVDRALVAWGFAVGPLTVLDQIGIDVVATLSRTLEEAFGDRMAPPLGLDRLLSDQRLGQRTRRGFYSYLERPRGKQRKQVDPGVYSLLGVTESAPAAAGALALRCVLLMVNEAARCLEEGILRNPRDGDLGAVFGLGFPPFRGGPFRYIDATGPANIVRLLQDTASEHGSRFAPAELLVKMAEADGSFYD